MPRRLTPKKFETCHITIRCNNKEYLFYLNETYPAFVSWINTLPLMYQVDIHHAVFMSNHMHLLVTPNENNLGQAMSYFLTNLAKFLNFKLKRNDHIFGQRYHPTLIKDSKHFMNAIRYIYQNPIRAKITRKPSDYKYSSLGFYLGSGNDGLIVKPDLFTKYLFDLGLAGRLHFEKCIDQNLSEDDITMMQACLSKRKFKFTKRQLSALPDKKITLSV